jgi:hypothetical protein
MKKLLLGAVTMMIVASPALAGHNRGPSWRSDASSDPPPVMGKTFGAYPYGPRQYENTLPPRTKRDAHTR